MDFGPGGEWGWFDRTVQSSTAAGWRNPADGFGTGCTDWGLRTSCLASATGSPDQVFRLTGSLS